MKMQLAMLAVWCVGAGALYPPLFEKAGSDFLGSVSHLKNSEKEQKRFFGIYNNCKPYIYKLIIT
jgi:hypothetical protein